jgi:hypothetical protein
MKEGKLARMNQKALITTHACHYQSGQADQARLLFSCSLDPPCEKNSTHGLLLAQSLPFKYHPLSIKHRHPQDFFYLHTHPKVVEDIQPISPVDLKYG